MRIGPKRRTGFTLLEFQVALVVFGIALAGLYPLVVMHTRQQKKLEARLDPAPTWYVIPQSDPWARKLGAAASLVTQDPGPPAAAPLLVLDNGDPGYTEAGTGWGAETQPQAFRGNHRWHAAGTAEETATWQFTGLIPGWYEVRITWKEAGNRGTNVPFSVLDDATPRGSFLVNQTLAPSGAIYEDRPWHTLGIVTIASGICRVRLSAAADGRVVADGVRLLPVRNVVSVNSMQRSLNADTVTVSVGVTIKVPQ